ncbi:MAG: DUF4365 domain-containing protein [Gemmatimonadota bacterium]|nr:DUF4365 domain-containing protein [Gemmatimonadota bacterium]
MPTRPDQHSLEDKSRDAFGLILPDAWVFRKLDKDYGLDGEVEIFDAARQATGRKFNVQLKATRSTLSYRAPGFLGHPIGIH